MVCSRNQLIRAISRIFPRVSLNDLPEILREYFHGNLCIPEWLKISPSEHELLIDTIVHVAARAHVLNQVCSSSEAYAFDAEGEESKKLVFLDLIEKILDDWR